MGTRFWLGLSDPYGLGLRGRDLFCRGGSHLRRRSRRTYHRSLGHGGPDFFRHLLSALGRGTCVSGLDRTWHLQGCRLG